VEKIILIKYDRPDLENLVEESEYIVMFERSKANIIFPGPKYLVADDYVTEHYACILSSLDKTEIIMKYKGKSTFDDYHLFEIDSTQINRNRKINELLDGRPNN
jgi:hypothetical protein